ncbi:MAG TPA: DUF4124 domain-containing protein [Rhodanobacteraceae bacterium]|nr:DUF4124 domain-containing protein [Rhodanobacteraceae bacterium]
MWIKVIVAVWALLGIAGTAQAQRASHGDYRYKWRDGSGLLHYSDSLTNDALKYGYDVLNERGMTVRHVARQLTAEQHQAARAEAQRSATAQRLSERQHQADLQMLAAYPDETAYKAAQQAQLDDLRQHIRTTQLNLRSQEQGLADLLDNAAELERADKDVPQALATRIAAQKQAVATQRAELDRQQAAQVAAGQQAVADLQRYRKLRTQQQAQTGP